MALQYLFDPNKQFQSLGGVNEVGGFLRVFLNGTDDRATTYKNFDGTLNEADIVLDSYGRAVVIVDDTKTYRIEVYNRLGGLMWTVSNYKASGGSGGGSGTPVSVEGTVGEIDVDENTEGGVKHFVVGLASTIKNAITVLQLAVNSIGLSLNGKKDKQSPVSVSGGTTKTLVGISQDSDGVMTAEFDDIAFPDWTSAINAAVATCEKLENKKTTVTGFESSNTYYPTIKAVVDFVHGMLQNLGGKLITDNGDPFTDSSDLPSTTPYGGVDIADKDYAYVQGTGFAERWSASVSGSDVTWVQEYSINIPVFTPAQQAAIDSGATSTKINNYELHINNTAIHVTSSEKNAWNAKQNAIGDLAEIRSGAAAGATALQPNGNGSNVTSTFTAASSRTNISSGEKLSIIFGKIAKWFADLKALAFKDKVSDSDISGTIADAHIASASTWNGKQNALPTSGTSSSTYAINVSGTAKHLDCYGFWHTYGTGFYDSSKPYAIIGELNLNLSGNTGAGQLLQFELDTSICARIRLDFKWSGGSLQRKNVYIIDSSVDYSTIKNLIKITYFTFTGGGNSFLCIRLYVKFTAEWQVWRVRQLDCQTGDNGFTNWMDFPLRVGSRSQESTEYGTLATYKFSNPYANGQIGSVTTPVYVDGNGELKECSLPSSVQTWSGTSYVSGLVEYSGGVYRIKADIPMNHSFGSGAHGFVNYEIFATALANKGTCKCSYSITPKYTGGGSGIAFVGMMPGQFIEGSSNVTPKTSLHVSGIGSCSLANATYLPNSLGVEIIVETSDWSVGDSVNFILNASIIKN